MRFDREAPGGGLDISVSVENGKAEIFFTVYLVLEQKLPEQGTAKETGRAAVEITMHDDNENQAACLWIPAGKDGTEYQSRNSRTGNVLTWSLSSRTLLIYPRLWRGAEEPCLYHIKALLLDEEQELDTLELDYPVCSMHQIPGRGFFLNEKEFPLRAVRYPVSACWQRELKQDLETMKELGANCICPDRLVEDKRFYELCLKKGILVWKEEKPSEIPLFCGKKGALLDGDRRRRNDIFYYYQACWSSRKVLHICCSRQQPKRGGQISVLVYSNQKKVALYVDGILQEFKQSVPRFLFEDIPANRETIVISAQAGECFTSVTWHTAG